MGDSEEVEASDQRHGWRRRLQTPALVVAVVTLPLVAISVSRGWAKLQEEEPRRPRAMAVDAFDLSILSIPRGEVFAGGPPKDGIPALNDPAFIDASDAEYLQPDDQVIGVAFGGEAKAYPLRVLDYHEIVNDTVGGRAIAVTYCPLCDSSVVFDRRLGGDAVEFGVSGLLYNSNVLMYDRRDTTAEESLWSQMLSEGVSAGGMGQRLRRLPLEVTTWASWRERHPGGRALSLETGHPRRYDRSAYAGYFKTDQLMFPVGHTDDRLPPKTPVLGVAVDDASIAYPVAEFAMTETRPETLAGAAFTLIPHAEAGSLRVETDDQRVEWCYSFWFAWSAFAPETAIARP